MARRVLFKVELAILTALQVGNFCVWLFVLWAHVAQAQTAVATASTGNPNVVRDFMAILPPSDHMRRNASYNSESVHPFQGGPATYRIYDHKDAKAKQALLLRAQSAFTSECSGKGGAIASRYGSDYALTVERLRPNASDATILICVRSDRRPLGMLITLERIVGIPTSGSRLGRAERETVYGEAGPYYLIALLPPSAVYTQERLDREAAELAARQQREAAERERAEAQERAEVAVWRRAIKPGTETGCGPVLRVNGDLIEVAHFRTRDPRWYRRSELWPSVCR